MKIATKKHCVLQCFSFFLSIHADKVFGKFYVLTDYSCTLTTSVCAKYFVPFLDASASSREVLSGPV